MASALASIEDVYTKLAVPFWALLSFSFLSISALVFFSIHTQNQNSIQSSIHLADAVLKGQNRDLATLIRDYSFWDQAVENIVKKPNLDWADLNIGLYLNEAEGITSSYALDANDAPIYAQIDGIRQQDNPLSRFSGGLEILLERARSGDPTADPSAHLGYLVDNTGIHLAVASVFTDYQVRGEDRFNQQTSSILLLTQRLDDKFLADLSENFLLSDAKVLRNLTLEPAASLRLLSPDNHHIATLTWTPERLGDRTLPFMISGIFVVFISMAIIAYFFLKRVSLAAQTARGAIESDKAKSEFLTNMSHELRTPLNAIIGFSDIMRNQLFGPMGNDKYLNYTSDINAAGDHLLSLINEILDLARIEAGQWDLIIEEVDLNEILLSSLRFINKQALDKNIQLNIETSEDLPRFSSDQRVLKQIILNILSNSVKFTPNGGCITCRTSLTENKNACLLISDTGIGIIEADIPKILKPFGQVTQKNDLYNVGSGLGLPITRKMIVLLGGSFTFQSEVNVGTQVSICLPL
ncbi:MAG: ATP-binding protein [Sneathiella sp.]